MNMPVGNLKIRQTCENVGSVSWGYENVGEDVKKCCSMFVYFKKILDKRGLKKIFAVI